ncbi:MAG: APC family permease, partial [Gaiellaceae bacterium]
MTESGTHQGHFVRVLHARQVIVLAFGAMIGWSWVLLTGEWIRNAGSIGTFIAFMTGGIAIVFIGLTYAELASAMPKAGGEHVYTRRALGERWSFVCTWALLFSYVNICTSRPSPCPPRWSISCRASA